MQNPVMVCLDLEGVLVPEIWINVAVKTGIEELKITTREMPDYDALMKRRLRILDAHKLTLTDIQEVIGTMSPLEGAPAFLNWLRERCQFIILSDTFYQFALPLMRQLDYPTLFCNQLEVDQTNRITNYRLRLPDQKRHSVLAFQSLGYRVVAAGDSYNDTSMLLAADAGFLFRAPEHVRDEFPQLPAFETYADLTTAIAEHL